MKTGRPVFRFHSPDALQHMQTWWTVVNAQLYEHNFGVSIARFLRDPTGATSKRLEEEELLTTY